MRQKANQPPDTAISLLELYDHINEHTTAGPGIVDFSTCQEYLRHKS